MDDWVLYIAFHYPHDRFALGWDCIGPDEQHDYHTVRIYLLIATLTLDVSM